MMRLWTGIALLVLAPAVLSTNVGRQVIIPALPTLPTLPPLPAVTNPYDLFSLLQIDSLAPLLNPSTIGLPMIPNLPDHFNILDFNNGTGTTVVAISNNVLNDFINKLNSAGVKFTTLTQSLTSLFGGGLLPLPGLRADFLSKGDATFSRFMTYDEINTYLEELPKRYPKQVDVEDIGTTYEGRPIKMVVINKRRSANNDEKPVIFLEAGSNAREWVGTSSALYQVEHLLDRPAMTRKFEWRIIPLLNPDGYAYAWEHDRLWSKNRARTSSPGCAGVDLNRNFDVNFGRGLKVTQCSSFYEGPAAFSEAETQALKKAVEEVQDRTKGYLSLRAFGQTVLYPETERGRDATEELKTIAEGMTRKIRMTNSVTYTVHRSEESAMIGGAPADWVAGQGVPYVLTLELRDKGRTAFNLPSELIAPTGEDLLAATKYFAKQIDSKKKRRRGD